MLWSKQYYHFVVYDWLDGDPASRLRRRYGAMGGITAGVICLPAT